MKYPLQKELEKDLHESVTLLGNAQTNGSDAEKETALKYYTAIKRIMDICVNRNRY